MVGRDPRGHLLALSIRLAVRVADGLPDPDVGAVLRRRVERLVIAIDDGLLDVASALGDAVLVETVTIPPFPARRA